MTSHPVFQLLITHFRSFFRVPGAIFWSFAFPVLIAWVLGIAFSNSHEASYNVYIDRSDSTEIQTVLKGKKEWSVAKDQYNSIAWESEWIYADSSEIMDAVKTGKTFLYLTYDRQKIQFHFDPSNKEAETVFLLLQKELNENKVEKNYEVIGMEVKGTRYIDYLFPGLLAMGIMNSSVWGIGWFLIEMRMKKLLRRMVATPMKKSHFILSKAIAQITVNIFESLTLFLFSAYFFAIEMKGSFAAFVLCYASGVIVFVGIGMLMASRTQSTTIGNGLINAVLLPMTILSGIFFSYQGFPDIAVSLIELLPLTMLADSMRGIFNQGFGIQDVLVPCLVNSGIGLTCYLLALKIFRWY